MKRVRSRTENRKRRVREAAESEKRSFLDRAGKNVQKVYGHEVWGKVAMVATVVALSLLARKTGQMLKRNTSFDPKAAEGLAKAASVAQGVISSPAGLVNLFHHLFSSMTDGANAESVVSKPATDDKAKVIVSDLITTLQKSGPGKVLSVTYSPDGKIEFSMIPGPHSADYPPGTPELGDLPGDWVEAHERTNTARDVPGSPESSSDSDDLSPFYEILTKLFTPQDLEIFVDKYNVEIKVTADSTSSHGSRSPHRGLSIPTFPEIIDKLSRLKPPQMRLMLQKLDWLRQEGDTTGKSAEQVQDEELMMILEILWKGRLEYKGERGDSVLDPGLQYAKDLANRPAADYSSDESDGSDGSFGVNPYSPGSRRSSIGSIDSAVSYTGPSSVDAQSRGHDRNMDLHGLLDGPEYAGYEVAAAQLSGDDLEDYFDQNPYSRRIHMATMSPKDWPAYLNGLPSDHLENFKKVVSSDDPPFRDLAPENEEVARQIAEILPPHASSEAHAGE